ncbi:MAG: Transcription factor TFIIIB component B [Cirrosporium novae-zelandiae]|nr:MAG: Transcription factor TFIIIB component B [Cirrosporium novae-zelandiae]
MNIDVPKDKSGKKFAPKAPARRPGGASTSHTASARSTADRQKQAKTVQPPLTQPARTAAPGLAPKAAYHEPSHIREASVEARPSPPPTETAALINSPIQKPVIPASASTTQVQRSKSPYNTIELQNDEKLQKEKITSAKEQLHLTPSQPSESSTQKGIEVRESSTGHANTGSAEAINAPKQISTEVYKDTTTSFLRAAKRRRIEIEIAEESPQDSETQSPSQNLEIEPQPPARKEADTPIVQPSQLEQPTTRPTKKTLTSRNQERIDQLAADVVADAVRPGKRKRKPPKKKTSAIGGSTTTETENEARENGTEPEAPTKEKPKRKRVTKRKTQNSQKSSKELAQEIVDEATEDTRKSKRTQRHRRALTPENAESIEIVPGQVKMSDLCKDLRLGKKSKREAELQKMDLDTWNNIVKDRQEQTARQEAGEDPPPETVDERLARIEAERTNHAPRMRIINGEIVVDDMSLQIDRHAEADAAAGEMEEVEENQLTRRVNSGSFMKRERTQAWDQDSTDLFYKGLQMFGTDFMMISKMFPDRTRRQIKLKYNKEEREDPIRIKECEANRIPVNMEEFAELSGIIYEDVEVHEREMEEDRRKLEEEMAREKELQEELQRNRDAELEASGAIEGQENEDSEIAGGKGGKKSKKNKKNKGKKAPSGEVEVLGTIEEVGQLMGGDDE